MNRCRGSVIFYALEFLSIPCRNGRNAPLENEAVKQANQREQNKTKNKHTFSEFRSEKDINALRQTSFENNYLEYTILYQ